MGIQVERRTQAKTPSEGIEGWTEARLNLFKVTKHRVPSGKDGN